MANASATLTYSINPTRVPAATLVNLMRAEAVPILPEIISFIGGNVTADATAVVGGQAVRTITWQFTAGFKAQFPDGSNQAAVFNNLLTQAIERSTRHPVVSSVTINPA